MWILKIVENRIDPGKTIDASLILFHNLNNLNTNCETWWVILWFEVQ